MVHFVVLLPFLVADFGILGILLFLSIVGLFLFLLIFVLIRLSRRRRRGGQLVWRGRPLKEVGQLHGDRALQHPKAQDHVDIVLK
jgi:hypothetical protein